MRERERKTEKLIEGDRNLGDTDTDRVASFAAGSIELTAARVFIDADLRPAYLMRMAMMMMLLRWARRG